jgi:HTH-type transcriptional regulator / antitoxin HigA
MTDIAWAPTWAVSPGEVLTEALEERGMSQAELGRRMARPLKTISEIATGKAAITPETAIQLERALGITAGTWLGLESRYREARARERDLAELDAHVAWLSKFPVKDLVARGILSRGSRAPQRAGELLSFFGVSNPAGWEQHWGKLAGSYRMSERLSVSPYAVAVWLREAERAIGDRELPEYSADRLRALVVELRSLTRASTIGGAIGLTQDLLESVGVGLLLLEGITGAPASGALRWIRGRPWIILTLRYRVDDQFWFSLFHEIGHLLEGGRRPEVLEGLDEDLTREDEVAANDFARETLLPTRDYDDWVGRTSIDREAIREFAARQGVAPGIVVGRLQRDRRVPPSRFNDLKRPVGSG